MMTNDTIGCGHCGRPADLCDCGVDYELAYRPQAEDFRARYRAQVDSSARGWVALMLGLGAVMALRILIMGWDTPIPNVANLATGDVCSTDQGKHWFKARADGMCYSADAPTAR